MPNILLVEDDKVVRDQIEHEISDDGHRVVAVADGAAALKAVSDPIPDLVVLDLRLPDIDGIEICRRFRDRGLCMPILMVTGDQDTRMAVLGIESGADDYVKKPFHTPELLARIRRHTARYLSTISGNVPIVWEDCFLRIDVSGGRVWCENREIELTSKEFDLLLLLVRNADQLVSRERLLEQVWQLRPNVTTRTIDTHIANLRRKLERDPAHPERVLTVHGRGYRYVTERVTGPNEPI